MTKTFIITGASSSNKGAQAMMFATAYRLMIANPGCDIWVFSNAREEDIYTFNVINWDERLIKRLLLGNFKYFFKKSVNYFAESTIESLLLRADAIYDISGFALSAKFGFTSSLNYLLRIALAKKYKCDLHLLPQSFGPFNYKKLHQRLIINVLMKILLKYPKSICSREAQGFNDLKHYTKNNLRMSLDMVLLTETPSFDSVYKNNQTLIIPDIGGEKAVAVIPNTKIIVWNNNNNIMLIYKLIIELLIQQGYKIYILRHSYEDLRFCLDIQAMFSCSSQMELFVDDYNCIELHNLISKMDFIIASRYHSLMHAYKSGVPAVVIGWAEKYLEVMSEFQQEKFYFDIRSKIDISKVNDATRAIANNFEVESLIINRKLVYIKKDSFLI